KLCTLSYPMLSSPALTSSSPATRRSAVDLPEPDGPTRTTNSPSATSSVRSSTARVPSGKTLATPSKAMPAISGSRPRGDQVAVPAGAVLGRAPLGRVVDVDDPEALG